MNNETSSSTFSRLGLRLLMGVYGMGLALLLVMHSSLQLRSELQGIKHALEPELNSVASLVAGSAAAALAFDRAEDLTELLSALAERPYFEGVAIYNQTGGLFAAFAASSNEVPALTFGVNGLTFSATHALMVMKIQASGETVGTLLLQRSLEDLREKQHAYVVRTSLILGVALLISSLFFLWIQRQVIRPLEDLTETAAHVGQDQDYAVRVLEDGGSEVRALAASFNGMLEEIQRTQLEREALTARLQQAKVELEQKVAERTRSLKERTERVEHLNGELASTLKNLQQSNRRLEQAMRQVEETNEELEAFNYSASHDLRAPLRSVEGFSKAVLEDYAGLLDDKGKDFLNRICRATQQMGGLMDDLLRLSRIARQDMTFFDLDLSRLADDAIRQLREIEPARVVEFVCRPGLSGFGDKNLMAIVLQNLLGNAWKFTGKRARARVEFGSESRATGTVYFVRDNGAGFDMKLADRLFGAFQRLHRDSDFPGTGVGLATVRRILHRHGGRVWAEGAVEQGATIYFTLAEKPA